jgi:hypothetical protein
MKTEFLLFAIFAIALANTLPLIDSSDTLAGLFISKTDTARRLNVRDLENDPRIFQLAYGLKRQSRYDLIRQFLHPNIQDIVLYGSQPFYITVGTNDEGGIDATYDWFLSADRYADNDRRDTTSTYVMVHAPGYQNKRWLLTPVDVVYPSGSFFIQMYADETLADTVDQTNWYLTAARVVGFDISGAAASHLIIQQGSVDSNAWVLTPQLGGDCFAIQLAQDGTVNDGNDMTGWFVSRGESKTNVNSDPDNISLYAVIQAAIPSHLWNIKMAS